MHCWLFKDMHFAWSEALTMLAKDPLKFNDGTTAC